MTHKGLRLNIAVGFAKKLVTSYGAKWEELPPTSKKREIENMYPLADDAMAMIRFHTGRGIEGMGHFTNMGLKSIKQLEKKYFKKTGLIK